MRSALARRRYDWNWFSRAVNIALSETIDSIQSDSPIFGLLPNFTPSLVYGLLNGMRNAGFHTRGGAFRFSDDLFQCVWNKKNEHAVGQATDFKEMLIRHLNTRGEPVGFQRVILLAIWNYFQTPFNGDEIKSGEQDFKRLENRVRQLTNDRNLLESYAFDAPGGKRWWLVNERDAFSPITERMESVVHDLLLRKKKISFCAIDEYLCKEFPGFLTPEKDLLRIILESYAEVESDDSNQYILRQSEESDARERDIREAKNLLKKIGESLGQKVSEDTVITWQDQFTNKISYQFYITNLAHISKFVYRLAPDDATEHVIVFPGSRSALLSQRIRKDPRLSFAVEQGWHFLKFRYLRRLADIKELDLNRWRELLDSDPPLWDPPTQLKII